MAGMTKSAIAIPNNHLTTDINKAWYILNLPTAFNIPAIMEAVPRPFALNHKAAY
jgi:hypothetical protein